MIADNSVDSICFCVCVWSGAIGMLVGAHWTRREWIRACLKRKLLRFDSATGKLTFVCDRGEVP
jgi:hypothetical protein